MSQAAGAERGFTLLELLVVFVLLGFAVLVVAPRFQPQESALERTAREIVRDLLELRARAIDQARIETVELAHLTRAPGADVMLEGNETTAVSFYPDGTASNALLSLVDASGRRITLQLEGLSGRIIRARE